MKVLIIGGGGREHALAYKVAQSTQVSRVYIAPGNAGTERENKICNINIPAEDINALKQFASDQNIHLTIVGPEAPLVAGIVDIFQTAGLRIFGPTAKAAQLEGSKVFSKDFLKRHAIPTATYRVFTDKPNALDYVRQGIYPVVIKADGLAAGKGVIIAQTESEASDALSDMLDANLFGDAGHRVIIEEFLQGEEVSFICMVDGEHILPLATSQDHKARDNADLGPNTGGMGAYSPAPRVDDALHEKIMQSVIEPTVSGMMSDGLPFTGFLYAGLMISDTNEIKTLEFNVRFGDPETQPIMMRLKSDMVELCNASIDKRLDKVTAKWDPRTALGVVIAAGGYPNKYKTDQIISGLDKVDGDNCKVFHAGTKRVGDTITTHGGRVLCVVGMGEDVLLAQKEAYAGVNNISWKDCYFRDDIGYRAVAKLKNTK